MEQRTFASQGSFERYGRKSRRELFLDEMELVVPWSELQGLVEPHYAKAGNGRRPVGLALMLRTYFLQQWFNLSDPGVEEALYESPVLRRLVGVDLGVAAPPDETTVCRFRHLLEKHDLGGADAGSGERASGGQGHPHRDRHDRRCDDYPRAFVDEEPERQTRPGDASDPQGPTVVCVTNTSESS
jgi:hypothetical protein